VPRTKRATVKTCLVTRTLGQPSRVEVFLERFAWSLPIVKTPTPNSQLRHARQLNHAQIRRAVKTCLVTRTLGQPSRVEVGHVRARARADR